MQHTRLNEPFFFSKIWLCVSPPNKVLWKLSDTDFHFWDFWPICQNWGGGGTDCPNGTVWYKQLPGRCPGASVCDKGQKPQSVRPAYWEYMAGSHDMGLSCPKIAGRVRWLRPCSSAVKRLPDLRGSRLQGTIPRIFHSVIGGWLWVEETWNCDFHWLQGLRSIIYAFTQTSRWTHTHIHSCTVHHTYPPVFVSRHLFFLNASLL